jgi:hypothetical protein
MFIGLINSFGSGRGLVLTVGGVIVLPVTGGRLTITGFLGRKLSELSLGGAGWPKDSILFDEDPGKFVPPILLSVLGLRAATPIPPGFVVDPRLIVEGVIRVTLGPWPGRFCACDLFGGVSGAPLLSPGLVVTFPEFAALWLSAMIP